VQISDPSGESRAKPQPIPPTTLQVVADTSCLFVGVIGKSGQARFLPLGFDILEYVFQRFFVVITSPHLIFPFSTQYFLHFAEVIYHGSIV
jgi:hypothetical protein